MTGEDLPVRKEQRHRVVAGSVVEEGRIRIEAQRVGSDTTTARVANFIQSSLESRSDTQRMADELADKRVWFTLITGGLVYAVTRDLTRLQSVFWWIIPAPSSWVHPWRSSPVCTAPPPTGY
ncbi:P-type ATPase [Candidatus Thiothrix anitrata]|uniref:P-type ATPase n=1 Tax=Candidatus Thiothrix anitrata TaxID=2823902 RepID=UPI001D1847E5|nr:hypothetical protein [Candidatus Thiothrix anitrata]